MFLKYQKIKLGQDGVFKHLKKGVVDENQNLMRKELSIQLKNGLELVKYFLATKNI